MDAADAENSSQRSSIDERSVTVSSSAEDEIDRKINRSRNIGERSQAERREQPHQMQKQKQKQRAGRKKRGDEEDLWG